jgi:XamI restriction endonuclease
MPVNANKPHLWKADVAQSVDLYDDWFMRFAPQTYRTTRVETTKQVEQALTWTANLTNIAPTLLRQYPSILPMLRMVTAPPLARDRLVGLARVSKNLVKSMEVNQRIPPRMRLTQLNDDLAKIGNIILQLADRDLFTWLETANPPTEAELRRAASVVADRYCGASADPIIRNAQERRQLAIVKQWLEARGYKEIPSGTGVKFNQMPPGTFSARMNVPGKQEDSEGNITTVNIPVDTVVMPLTASPGDFPLLIEAKSAGDFTNTNKRRKEEATKISQLRLQHGPLVRYVLFLCGYFDSGYLGYEAAEGIDWVWEHRVDDLAEFGV